LTLSSKSPEVGQFPIITAQEIPNPDKPEIPNHKYQIPNKSQCPKFKIPNANMILKEQRSPEVSGLKLFDFSLNIAKNNCE